MTTAKDIWQTLSKIDVSGKTEKKGNLTYLSWAWAWGTLMDHYPESQYFFDDDTVFSDGSVMVHVAVHIKEHVKTMWLPVLNYKNQAIQNPSAMDINTARMRCLTKCLAMFGLGHYIYAGEDLPEAVKEDNQHKKEMLKKLKKAVANDDHFGVAEFYNQVTKDDWKKVIASLDNEPEKAKYNSLKSKGMKLYAKVLESYEDHKANGRDGGMAECMHELKDSPYWQERLQEAVK